MALAPVRSWFFFVALALVYMAKFGTDSGFRERALKSRVSDVALALAIPTPPVEKGGEGAECHKFLD